MTEHCDPCNRPCTISPDPDPCDVLFPWAALMRDCVCASLEASVGGPVCQCMLTAGTSTAYDNCCQGQAWIRVVSVYPSKSFPTPDGSRFRCDHQMMAAELEIGVVRCAPTMDDDGNPPSVQAIEESFRVVHSDRVRVMRALSCCFRPEQGCEVINIGQWTPVAEQGGCVGGMTDVTISFNDCDCCCDDDFGHERLADGSCGPAPDPGDHVTST